MESVNRAKDAFEPELKRASVYIRQRTAETNDKYLQPLGQQYIASAKASPVAVTALTLFFAFSAIPLATFVIFAALFGATLIGSALIFVSFWLFVILGGASVLLLAVLIGTALMALTGTGALIACFLCYRLVSNVRSAPTFKSGVMTLGDEVKGYANVTAANGVGSGNGHLKPE